MMQTLTSSLSLASDEAQTNKAAMLAHIARAEDIAADLMQGGSEPHGRAMKPEANCCRAHALTGC